MCFLICKVGEQVKLTNNYALIEQTAQLWKQWCAVCCCYIMASLLPSALACYSSVLMAGSLQLGIIEASLPVLSSWKAGLESVFEPVREERTQSSKNSRLILRRAALGTEPRAMENTRAKPLWWVLKLPGKWFMGLCFQFKSHCRFRKIFKKWCHLSPVVW